MQSLTPGKEVIQQDTEHAFRPSSAPPSLDSLLKDTQEKAPALKTQAVFKLQRHRQHSCQTNIFYSNMENDSIDFNTSFIATQLYSITFLALF